MYRLIINNYEDSHRRLVKENEGMRQYLKEMQDELIAALNERSAQDQSGVKISSFSSVPEVENMTNFSSQTCPSIA